MWQCKLYNRVDNLRTNASDVTWLPRNHNMHMWMKYKRPIISSVPDTSAPHFGIHKPKMKTQDSKRCLKVSTYTRAEFCPTKYFLFAKYFFEKSIDKGRVSSGLFIYHAKKLNGIIEITAKLNIFHSCFEFVGLIYTSYRASEEFLGTDCFQ